MPEKREPSKSVREVTRKTRVTWSRLYCLNPNPDRATDRPVTTPIDAGMETSNRDVIEYLPLTSQGMIDTI